MVWEEMTDEGIVLDAVITSMDNWGYKVDIRPKRTDSVSLKLDVGKKSWDIGKVHCGTEMEVIIRPKTPD